MVKKNSHTPLYSYMTLVACFFLILWSSIATLITGNMWVRHDTIAEEFSRQYGYSVRVVSMERHVWRASRVVFAQENGKNTLYEIDSDLLFRYEFNRKD